MIAVISFAVNIIALALIAWIVVMFYFAFENYRKGEEFCINHDVVNNASDALGSAYKWVKRENFEDKDLVPYDMSEDAMLSEDKPALTPDYTQDTEEENYNDVLLGQLEPVILEQHAAYVADSSHATRGASMQMEKSNTDDIVPQWGLRRVKYGANILSKNAVSVPSFEYAGDTKQTDLYKMIGM